VFCPARESNGLLLSCYGSLLVLERISFALTRHYHGEGPQGVKHLDRSFVVREHLGKAAIGHRAFVEVRANEYRCSRSCV